MAVKLVLLTLVNVTHKCDLISVFKVFLNLCASNLGDKDKIPIRVHKELVNQNSCFGN